MTRHSEAFRQLEETQVRLPPSYPPPADERAETRRYLPAVPEFFGIRCCHPANVQLPHTAQHSATLAYEALERTLDIGPASGVRATAPSVSRADTPPPSTSGSGEEAACGAGRQGVLTALTGALATALTACSGHDYVFGCGFMSGIAVGAVLTAMAALVLDARGP